MEQSEYASEAIDVTKIEFVDNEESISLIEGKIGIIAMLDEEVFIPKGSDHSLIEKLHKAFYKSDKERHKKYGMIKKKNHVFIVTHYAGEVEYDINGFLDKNKDSFESLIERLFSESRNPILSEIFQKHDDGSKSSGPSKRITLASQFKGQLSDLLITLNNANPQFVRCIKPNNVKVANVFNGDMVLKQLSYAG